jgi:hypothetical protein
MGDFVTVRLMSGGQSTSVGLMMANQLAYLQYPAAAAMVVGQPDRIQGAGPWSRRPR